VQRPYPERLTSCSLWRSFPIRQFLDPIAQWLTLLIQFRSTAMPDHPLPISSQDRLSCDCYLTPLPTPPSDAVAGIVVWQPVVCGILDAIPRQAISPHRPQRHSNAKPAPCSACCGAGDGGWGMPKRRNSFDNKFCLIHFGNRATCDRVSEMRDFPQQTTFNLIRNAHPRPPLQDWFKSHA
jgi:hypothetical protein